MTTSFLGILFLGCFELCSHTCAFCAIICLFLEAESLCMLFHCGNGDHLKASGMKVAYNLDFLQNFVFNCIKAQWQTVLLMSLLYC